MCCTEPECAVPVPPPVPAHGALKCSSVVREGVQQYPRTCKVMCQEGYEIRLKSSAEEHIKAIDHIHCHWDGKWEVDPEYWPDCARELNYHY